MRNILTNKSAFTITAVLSAVVVLLVALMFTGVFSFSGNIPSFIYRLPLLHAILNGTTAVLLVLSLLAIKAKKSRNTQETKPHCFFTLRIVLGIIRYIP